MRITAPQEEPLRVNFTLTYIFLMVCSFLKEHPKGLLSAWWEGRCRGREEVLESQFKEWEGLKQREDCRAWRKFLDIRGGSCSFVYMPCSHIPFLNERGILKSTYQSKKLLINMQKSVFPKNIAQQYFPSYVYLQCDIIIIFVYLCPP